MEPEVVFGFFANPTLKLRDATHQLEKKV